MPAVPVPVSQSDNSSTMLAGSGSSGGEAVAELAHEGSHETTGVLSNSVLQEEDKGDRNLYGGNRWPRQETLALLKIRSQMDAAFRDSSLKAPLWEDVSRKLGELGYYRSAKKCKEKFENVYKYHRRTKEGRSGKQEGKTYRFFDELEAFDLQNHHHHSSIIPPKPQVLLWPNMNNNHPNHPSLTIPHDSSTTVVPLSSEPKNTTMTPNGSQNGPHISPPPTNSLPPQITKLPVNLSHQYINGFKPNLATHNPFSSSTTSSTASDEEFQVQQRDKKKRKWKDFFRRLTKEVLEKQEKLQEKFLEAIAKCEHQRMVREEAWRMEEMASMDKAHEILAQERSSAAAKGAAVIEFLHKVSGQQDTTNIQPLEIQPRPQPPLPVLMPPPPPTRVAVIANTFEVPKLDNGKSSFPPGSTRWPRVEVEALINLRTCLDVKYQEAGPKGSLWEEISAGMRRLGYNRSAKRCKEKWENINKYFKKVKESSKTRPEDSKTCPYFNQLEAMYKKKIMNNISNVVYVGKPLAETMQPLIKVQPAQPVIEGIESENMDRNQDEDDGESTEEEDHGHDVQIEIVTNYKESPMEIVEP